MAAKKKSAPREPGKPKLVAFNTSSLTHLPHCGLGADKSPGKAFRLEYFRQPLLRPVFDVDPESRTLSVVTPGTSKVPPQTHVIPFENLTSMTFEEGEPATSRQAEDPAPE